MSTTKPTILIVEDEPKIAALLDDYLSNADYQTAILNDGKPAVEWIRTHKPDLVLLDLMLPNVDGIEICREVRRFSPLPIIMVTARVEEIDRLLGLEMGADDYICKPFSPREVVARVRNVLRRVSATAGTDHTVTGYRGIKLDEAGFRALVHDEPLELTPVEFRLLQTLMQQPGRVYGRGQLMDRVYTDGRVVSDRTMDSHVKNLRRKLAEKAGDEELIHSVYGVGYRLG